MDHVEDDVDRVAAICSLVFHMRHGVRADLDAYKTLREELKALGVELDVESAVWGMVVAVWASTGSDILVDLRERPDVFAHMARAIKKEMYR